MKQIKIHILPGTIGKYNEYRDHIYDGVEYREVLFDTRDGNVFCISPGTLMDEPRKIYADALDDGTLVDISIWCSDSPDGRISIKAIRDYLMNQFCIDRKICDVKYTV